MKIYPSLKIYLDKSPIHGLGVFASQPIKTGEIVEVCPVIDLGMSPNESSTILIHYRFNWPQGINPEKQVIPIGFGMIYNHSNTPNASWRSNFENTSFEFYAVKDINPGDEILVWYGDENYWSDGRQTTVVI